MAGSFPDGWSAVGVTYGEVSTFASGNTAHVSYVSNSSNGSSGISSAFELCLRLSQMMNEGHYVIIAVTQLLSTGSAVPPGIVSNGSSNTAGHWVVVNGITNQYVYINNPYTNRRERYSWDEFYDSWRHSWVEIIPPARMPANAQ